MGHRRTPGRLRSDRWSITGSPRGTHPTATASASAKTASDEQLEAIPLDGTDRVRLHWRIPQATNPQERAALLAAQRYTALDYNSGVMRHPEELAPLFRALSSGQDLAISRKAYRWDQPNVPAQKTLSTGPVWIWLKTRYTSADHIDIDVCADIGWWNSHNQKLTRPRKSGFRARWDTLTLRKVTNHGQPAWKVSHDELNPSKVSAVCTGWAKHTPSNH